MSPHPYIGDLGEREDLTVGILVLTQIMRTNPDGEEFPTGLR